LEKEFGKQVKIGVTGLNPHCESIDSLMKIKNYFTYNQKIKKT
jgi:hypothetical protein